MDNKIKGYHFTTLKIAKYQMITTSIVSYHLPIGAVRNLVSEIDILERVLLPLTPEFPILKFFFSFSDMQV